MNWSLYCWSRAALTTCAWLGDDPDQGLKYPAALGLVPHPDERRKQRVERVRVG